MFDPVRAHYEILIAVENIPVTAIATSFGLLEFTRIPFGLRNVAYNFNGSMAKSLGNLPQSFHI